MEEKKEYKGDYTDNSVEKCANMSTTSLYKMQLGINTIKDEMKILNETLINIFEEIRKK